MWTAGWGNLLLVCVVCVFAAIWGGGSIFVAACVMCALYCVTSTRALTFPRRREDVGTVKCTGRGNCNFPPTSRGRGNCKMYWTWEL